MSPPMPQRSALARVISIGLAIAVPAALWFVPPPASLSETGWRIALVVVGGAIAWLLEPVPDFAVALGMAAAWGATGLAPPALAFSGFASSAWVLAVAAFAITAAMASSGLLFRTALMLLRIFPPTHRGQVAALLLGGWSSRLWCPRCLVAWRPSPLLHVRLQRRSAMRESAAPAPLSHLQEFSATRCSAQHS